MEQSELHRAARRLASAGTPVFPCVRGSKVPACDNGFHDATTDLAQIDAWWAADPEYNIAFSPADVGLAIVDPDGQDGRNAWAALQIEHESVPDTFTVATPRGGLHVYFRGELPPSVGKLAPHVDTRGRGSYALLPPSRLTGWPEPYKTISSVKPADLPDWLRFHEVFKPKEKMKAAVDDLDQPANVMRAERLLKDYVKAGNVCVLGQMGDAKTYQVACEVMNLGLSEEKTFEVLWELWAPYCEPFEPDRFHAFLERKVANAAAYAQNEPGAWAVEPAQEVFKEALDKLVLDDAPARPSRFKLWTLEELAALPPPEFLIPDMFPKEGLSLVYGPPGSYKSFIVLQYAAELARAGQDVVYIGAEGGRGLELRASAWKLAHGVEGKLPLRIVRNMPWASDGQMVEEFIGEVRASGLKPCMVVIDTAARSMVGLNENDAKDVGLFIAALDAIKSALGCAVVAIHHTGKDEARGARGSMALLAAMDAAFEVKAEKDTKALAVYCRRQKDAQERETPWTYEGKSLADSLVFFPISAAEHRRLTTAKEITAKEVGAALVSLKARGLENAVSSHVLATQLLGTEDLTDDQRGDAIGRLSGLLGKRASGNLEAYATGKGASLRWFLP